MLLPASKTYALWLSRFYMALRTASAIMGVGASKSFKRVNWGIARNMVLAWVLTFPACGLIGFLLAHLFMMFA